MIRLTLCLALLIVALTTISTITLTHTYSAQADTHSIREFPITVKDVVFDHNTAKFYASIPSSAGAMGNSIAKIDPTTGQVENSYS